MFNENCVLVNGTLVGKLNSNLGSLFSVKTFNNINSKLAIKLKSSMYKGFYLLCIGRNNPAQIINFCLDGYIIENNLLVYSYKNNSDLQKLNLF